MEIVQKFVFKKSKNKNEMTDKSLDSFETKKDQVQKLDTETQSKIIENILLAITEHSESENECVNNTGRILDTIHGIADSLQQEFEELIDTDSNKKALVKNLSKLFVIRLNTNYITAEKIKRITKIAIEMMLKLLPEPKQW